MPGFNSKLLRVVFCGFALIFFQSCSTGPVKRGEGLHAQISAKVKHRITWTGTPFRVQIFKEKITAEHDLPKFYKRHRYQAVWVFDEGLHPRAQQLLEVIQNAQAEGLNPTDFHALAIQTLIEDWDRRRQLELAWNVDRFVDLEFLLTDAFFALAQQMQSGKVKPNMPGYEYFVLQKDRTDLVKVFEQAIETADVAATLHQLLPHQAGYERIKQALAEYRKIDANGGWRLIVPGQALRLGDRDKRVLQLRARLKASADLPQSTAADDPRVFDEPLQEALKRFQVRHGIPGDGVLGKGTVSALNVSVKKRVRQLEINLERWRWLPRDLGEKHLQVNIANYELKAMDGEHELFAMPVAVGTQYRNTPAFSGMLSHLVFNPYWFVPRKIATDDMLPKIKQNTGYITEKGVHVFKASKKRGLEQEVDAATIDWARLDDENFEYIFRQNAGPFNPLGKVKFMFPNKFNVYLHDTPSKDIFKKSVRDFSSGCIRVSKPMELAKYLLAWDDSQIQEVLAVSDETQVPLAQPMPVHLLYRTAWVDEQGLVNFRWDVYNQDELLEQFF